MTGSTYGRYVAIGDSQTEGLWDGDDEHGLRGWADRLAEHLTELNPELQYANLAVRGRLAGEVREEQLGPALALEPDLATVVAGMNDLFRPGFDADVVASDLEEMFAALTRAGAQVATLTFPNVAKLVPMAKLLMHRVVALNARIHEAAQRHDVAIMETFHHPVTTDPRIWSPDRMHASPLGHARIAAGMAEALDLPGSGPTWRDPLPPMPPSSLVKATTTELWWLASFFGPWIGRRVRGRSSGDGREPKRPGLTPPR